MHKGIVSAQRRPRLSCPKGRATLCAVAVSLTSLFGVTGMLVDARAARAAPNDTPASIQTAAAVRSVDEFVVVDCRLPPKVRKLGKHVVYQVPGRIVRTPARDCGIRGGEYTLFDPSNYKDAISLWLQSAHDGDSQAQTNLATLYEKANPPDYDAAVLWYKRAADTGYAPAQVSLGRLYELGVGVERDVAKAFDLYRQASGITLGSLDLITSADRQTEFEGLREELRQTEIEVRALQSEIEEQKREIEALGRMLRQEREAEESKKGTASGDAAALERLLGAMEKNFAASVKQVQEATERLERIPPPSLEILYPLATVKGKFRGLRVRAGRKVGHVVGRVISAAGIDRVVADDEPLDVDRDGYFLIPFSKIRSAGNVRLEALDIYGRSANLELSLDAGGAERSRPNTAKGLRAGQYVALVIGNDNFQFWESIDNAANDARAIARILREKYGFKVRLLIDVTRREMLSAFNMLRQDLGPGDKLLIYYAGHGHLVEEIDRGYWIPVNAETASDIEWILNDQITDYLQIIPAQQILVIADSCYSGVFTRTSIQRPKPDLGAVTRLEALRQLSSKRVRSVMTAGAVQPVLDTGPGGHSIFTAALLQVLSDNEEVLEANRLFDAIYPVVAQSSARLGYRQTPTYRAIKFAGHEGGDFVFIPQ